MKRARRLVPGIAALVLGFGCLNYTKAFGVEAHYEWAEATGFPPPSGELYFLGLGLVTLGGILTGSALGRGPARPVSRG